MHNPDKILIRDRFAGSLHLYASHATVQTQMAKRLIASVAKQHTSFDCIFEFGCGAGIMTREIHEHLRYRELLVNDLVPECRSYAESVAPGAVFIPGDIEQITLPSSLDLIISGATLQWLAEPRRTLAKFATALKPGGIFAATGFGPDNLHEIAGLTGTRLRYYSVEEWRAMLAENFTLIELSEHCEKMVFISPRAALEHLRLTGVTGVKTGIWTKTKLNNFIREYIARYSTEGGIALTYHPLLMVAVKR